MNERIEGRVMWFNDKKGYGFIKPDGGGKDVFVHHSGIDGEGYRSLRGANRVSFWIDQGKQGAQAAEVRRV
jgi:CspA family cold shock protein